MRRHLLFVSLLLMTGVALGEQASGQAAVPEAQTQTGAAPQQQRKTQAKLKPSQEVPAEAHAKKIPGQAKEPPAATETAGGKPPDAQSKTAQSTAGAQADKKEEPQAQTDQDSKLTSVPGSKALGMSILGNQEAPKALVIVPWKSSDMGRAPGISPLLDDSRQPVDKEVFMRALRYYEIKSQTKP